MSFKQYNCCVNINTTTTNRGNEEVLIFASIKTNILV